MIESYRNKTGVRHVQYQTQGKYINRMGHFNLCVVDIEMNVRDEYPDWLDIESIINNQEFIVQHTLEEFCGYIFSQLANEINADIKVVCTHVTLQGATITATIFTNQHP